MVAISLIILSLIFNVLFLPINLNAVHDTLKNWTNECFEKQEHIQSAKFVPESAILTFEELEAEINIFKERAVTGCATIKSGEGIDCAVDPYVAKITVAPGSKICFIGDIHGSIHSLLRNLIRLHVLNYLKNDFSINNENFYMIFLGDYVDYGDYGTEVLYTILKLKNKNWNNVFLLKGNHENITFNTSRGFINEEITKKNPDKLEDIKKCVSEKFYNYLPLALYIGSECATPNTVTRWIQCCHGGIDPRFCPKTFLATPAKPILSLKEVLSKREPDVAAEFQSFQNLEDIKSAIQTSIRKIQESHGAQNISDCNGFNWSDFTDDVETAFLFNDDRHSGFVTNNKFTKTFVQESGIEAIFRGHQHSHSGLKIGACDGSGGRNQHWKTYPSLSKKVREINGFGIGDIDESSAPVFTFSTAAEGASDLNYDCFGILTTASDYAEWKLLPYEFELSDKRGNKYAKITGYNDPIAIEFAIVPYTIPEDLVVQPSQPIE